METDTSVFPDKRKIEQRREKETETQSETKGQSLTELRRELNLRLVLNNFSNSIESNWLQLYIKSMISQPEILVTCTK